jgi:phosphatidylglycerol---prolipoprotein diacylglyceryl transferase
MERMSSSEVSGFPRFIRFGKRAVSTYKVCLGAGIYFGILISAMAAKKNGSDPISMALATLGCALVGLVGARVYHLALLAVQKKEYVLSDSAWDTSRGGGGLFGGLLAIVSVSPVIAALIHLPFGVFWDYLIVALLVGALWTRLGCFCNGCCGGREISESFAFRWHNHKGQQKKRIPVQLLEIGWMILAAGAVIYFFDRPRSAGAIALGVFAWYGLGRVILESLREEPDIAFSIRINQLIAAIIGIGAGFLLLFLFLF